MNEAASAAGGASGAAGAAGAADATGPADAGNKDQGDNAASGAGAAGRASEAAEPVENAGPWRLRDHIGVISGWVLGLIVVAFLVVLAAAGDSAAFAILVTVAIGAAMIFLGLKMRGPRG